MTESAEPRSDSPWPVGIVHSVGFRGSLISLHLQRQLSERRQKPFRTPVAATK
jgi:hypothetical protein